MKNRHLLVAFLVACFSAACAAPGVDEGADPAADGKADGLTSGAPVYESVYEYTQEIGTFDQWWGMVGQIRNDWDNICGDTFCGGDYSNLHALAFSCSVKISTGVLSRCKWVFAGSYETVNPTYGTVSTHAKTWSCNISVSGVKLTTLMDLLGKPSTIGDAAIQRKLPSGKSLYDSLGDCLP